MPKSNSTPTSLNSEAAIAPNNNYGKSDEKSGISGITNRIKNIFSSFNTEDILLILILFLLMQEGVNDDFLIIGIILLILTE